MLNLDRCQTPSRRMRLLAGGAAVVLTCLISPPVYAQTSDPEQDESTQVDEIVVTGVRASLEDALENKRDSGDVIDSISSEGIGKLPDLNLAESLQRVPGVQINRSAQRRLGTVSIRGLPGGFAQTTINGQYLANPDVSSFSYGAVRSEVFSGIDVIKAGSARNITGGLSGIVNLRTGDPLGGSEALILSLDGGYEEATEEWVPGGALVFSRQVIPGELAVRAALGVKNIDFREDNVQINTYERFAGTTTPDAADDILAPQQVRLATNRAQGDATTGSIGLAWRPHDNLTATFDGFYNVYTPLSYSSQYTIDSTPGASTRTLTGPVDDQGPLGSTWSSVRIVDPTLTVDSRLLDDQFTTQAYTGALEWSDDVWTLKGTLHYTEAERSRVNTGYQARQNALAGAASNGLVVDLNTGSGDSGRFAYDLSSGNPSLFVNLSQPFGAPIGPTFREVRATGTPGASFIGGLRNEGETEDELAIQFDVARTFDFGPISSIGVGGVYRDKSQSQFNQLQTLFSANIGVLNNSFYIPDFSTLNGRGAFFGGDLGMFDLRDYAELDVAALTAALRPANPTLPPPTTGIPNPGAVYVINAAEGLVAFLDTTALAATYFNEQKIYGGYLVADLDEQLTDLIRLRGNLGVRYERSERSTDNVDGLNRPTSSSLEYENWLPSANLTFEIGEDWVVRTAYNETLRRPQVDDFAVLRSIAVDGTGTLVTVGLGAVDLKPFTSKNLDISVEWYNRRGSSFSALVFNKEVEDFAGTTRICPTDGGGFGFGPLSLASGVCRTTQATPAQGTFRDVFANATVNINVVANQDTFTLRGYELSAQQNFDFLPAPFDGFGGSVNYTHIEFETDGTFRLSELSEDTANAIIYYETSRFGVRAAYVYRSGYFLGSGGTFTGADRLVDERYQLDLSGTLNLTDSLTLAAEAFNVTDEELYEYEGDVTRARNYTRYGRTFSVGLRYRF